ncbi:phosphodiester glycosidase family protein [Manganibacter manganicus]|uniref:Phosphodiester glycosidase domain-containing protein n=1 Tax=Manganibacter manganicus TaxID=1873176 RepID=A0A1V8RUE2_9HYPH|nr:phosphodiester glycosidase family protein [Pseudaminobacter manganicus]OQM76639.1 hypothetical protein BFN67_13490 [Pseudaminobacter manganicus]
MTRRLSMAILIGILVIAGLALALWLRRSATPPSEALPPPCHDSVFEGVGYVTCEIDLRTYEITLARTDANGKPYGTLKAFDTDMAARGTPVLLAMNAGMYHKDFSPVGLFVENGHETAPLNLSEGAGNFFMKPNGVFFIDRAGCAVVMESTVYAQHQPEAELATQSGPMLVIGGQLHPRFEEDGASRYVRNGVGVRADGTVVLAISRTPVSFGSFARLFRDELACPDALFLDGAISALSNGRRLIVGGRFPVGPILAVRARQ